MSYEAERVREQIAEMQRLLAYVEDNSTLSNLRLSMKFLQKRLSRIEAESKK